MAPPARDRHAPADGARIPLGLTANPQPNLNPHPNLNPDPNPKPKPNPNQARAFHSATQLPTAAPGEA